MLAQGCAVTIDLPRPARRLQLKLNRSPIIICPPPLQVFMIALQVTDLRTYLNTKCLFAGVYVSTGRYLQIICFLLNIPNPF